MNEGFFDVYTANTVGKAFYRPWTYVNCTDNSGQRVNRPNCASEWRAYATGRAKRSVLGCPTTVIILLGFHWWKYRFGSPWHHYNGTILLPWTFIEMKHAPNLVRRFVVTSPAELTPVSRAVGKMSEVSVKKKTNVCNKWLWSLKGKWRELPVDWMALYILQPWGTRATLPPGIEPLWWVPEPVCTMWLKQKFSALLGLEFQPFGRPARSQSLYRLLSPTFVLIVMKTHQVLNLPWTYTCMHTGTLQDLALQT
jgi:hypothetical protein